MGEEEEEKKKTLNLAKRSMMTLNDKLARKLIRSKISLSLYHLLTIYHG